MRRLGIIMLMFCVITISYGQIPPEGRRLIRSVIRNNTNYDRLYFKNCLFNLEYNGLELPEVKGNIKIVRDSAIQISIVPAFGIEAGRILLTKDSIFVINRLNKWFIADSWEDAEMESVKRFKMKELEDIFIGNLPSRARWVMRKDSMYRYSETERAFKVKSGKSDWNILTILDNRKIQLSTIIASRSISENFSIIYSLSKDDNGNINDIGLSGDIILMGYKLRGNVRMGRTTEDKGFRVGAQIGKRYARKSLISLKRGK
jgi:hypothetical protein